MRRALVTKSDVSSQWLVMVELWDENTIWGKSNSKPDLSDAMYFGTWESAYETACMIVEIINRDPTSLSEWIIQSAFKPIKPLSNRVVKVF